MNAPKDAYPLTWPAGWRRTASYLRKTAKFSRGTANHLTGGSASRQSINVGEGASRVRHELRAMGISESKILISSNLRLRLDGLPYANQATSDLDPGVAVYWRDKGRDRCMAIDRYTRLADNLAAIAATIAAMRAIERHGEAEILDRAFTGFAALAAPEQWWQVLGVGESSTREQIDEAYRRLASKHHPDRGGSAETMARINRARDQGLEGMHA